MIQIGLTGNIGSGKSTIAEVFRTIGIPVFVSDTESKFLMEHDAELINAIKTLLGEDAYLQHQTLNRNYIANIVFNNAEKLDSLNKIVHPAIEKYYIQWCDKHQQELYTIKEAAILFESGTYKTCDKIITVACDRDTAMKRAAQRDGKTIAEIEARLQNQMPQEEKKF